MTPLAITKHRSECQKPCIQACEPTRRHIALKRIGEASGTHLFKRNNAWAAFMLWSAHLAVPHCNPVQ